MNNIDDLIQQSMETDNGGELASILVELAGEFYYLSSKMGEAQDEYNKEVVKQLSNPEKKISCAEAERRSDALTDTEHDKIRFQLVAIQEVINAIKVKIKNLEMESKLGNIGNPDESYKEE